MAEYLPDNSGYREDDMDGQATWAAEESSEAAQYEVAGYTPEDMLGLKDYQPTGADAGDWGLLDPTYDLDA